MKCILRFGIVFVLDFVLCVSCFYRSCLLLFYDFYINFAVVISVQLAVNAFVFI